MKFTILGDIVERVQQRLSADKTRRPVSELKRRILDAAPTISFVDSISGPFGLIAEIKRKSPSQGVMRNCDVERIAQVYDRHSFVRAISVLTNRDDFEMDISDLAKVRQITKKPILRKDFIFDEYQIFEARAYGADAILLMANILIDTKRMSGLYELSKDLGLDVLFECREKAEIEAIPSGAKIYGINSRKLKARKVFGLSRYDVSRIVRHWRFPDTSVTTSVFDLAEFIPKSALKVAESGLVAHEIEKVRDKYRYNSALVGTAILNAPNIESALNDFSGSRHEATFVAPEVMHSR